MFGYYNCSDSKNVALNCKTFCGRIVKFIQVSAPTAWILFQHRIDLISHGSAITKYLAKITTLFLQCGLQFRSSYLPVRLCYCDRTYTKFHVFLWYDLQIVGDIPCMQIWSYTALKLIVISTIICMMYGQTVQPKCTFSTTLQNGVTYSIPEVVQYFVAHESIFLIKPEL